MYSADDIQYALETTHVLYEPDRRIDTFGNTRFEFQLLSELMDSVGQVRIRSGEVEAQRPTIIRPEPYQEIEFEGFGDDAKRFQEWLHEKGQDVALMKYGFQFKRGEVREELLHDSLDDVRSRVVEDARRVVQGIQPQQLRDQQSLREQIAGQLAQVEFSLDNLMVDRPRRNLIRNPK